jgi:hypothetical protein
MMIAAACSLCSLNIKFFLLLYWKQSFFEFFRMLARADFCAEPDPTIHPGRPNLATGPLRIIHPTFARSSKSYSPGEPPFAASLQRGGGSLYVRKAATMLSFNAQLRSSSLNQTSERQVCFT